MREENIWDPCCSPDSLQPPPPLFDLPPPPRPPWEDESEDCLDQRPLLPGQESERYPSHVYDFQSCDINSFVIDSHFYFGENLFTLLIIVICSCILVGIVMTVAIVIYRYENCNDEGDQFRAQLAFMCHSPDTLKACEKALWLHPLLDFNITSFYTNNPIPAMD